MVPATQRENSNWQRKSSIRNRDGKSPVRDGASPTPNSDKTDKSPSQRSSKRKSSQTRPSTERRLQKSPISTRRTSSNGSLRRASRGRPMTFLDKTVRKGQKGQTVLNFPAKSSSSASGKRPRSVDATPPHQPDKYSRQHDSNEESSVRG
ncbi:hypothetical protein ACOMHN_059914 [Nucella lapillus]